MATPTTPATGMTSPTTPTPRRARPAAKKKAAKGKGGKVERGAKAGKDQVRTAWNAGKKVIHHAVKVGNQTYASCWQAFVALKLVKAEDDYGPCVKFRKALKANGKSLVYTPEGKKPIKFELIAKA